MRMIESAMKHRQVPLVITCILVLAGIYSLTHMARREDPKMTIRQGLVIMAYPGARTSQVELQVTKKLEAFLCKYEEIVKNETESTTTDGSCVIQLELQGWVKNRDKFWSKLHHDLQGFKQSHLPPGTIGPMINSDFGDTVALLISVESDRHSYTQLTDALEIIEDELRPLAEVSKLKRYGEQAEQIYITTDSRKLARYGVTLAQVSQVLRAMNTVTYAGEIKVADSRIPIHTRGTYDSVTQILRQQIDITPKGEVVRVEDVARVERRYEEPVSFIRINNTKALLLSVEMQAGYNIVSFGEKVNHCLAAAKAKLPSDITLRKVVDQPSVVHHSIAHFLKEFLIAIVAVIVVMMVLLPLRVAFVSALAIPITIMITFACLDASGIELQQMTLAGLIVVLGMVVDNAIVIVDDYVERLDCGTRPWHAAIESASALLIPVFTATIAIICAFLPMDILLSGNAGEFLFSLPVSVAVALFVSLFIAIFVTPIFCYYMIKTGLKKEAKNASRPSALDRLQSAYDAILAKAFSHRSLTLFIGFLTILGTGILMGKLPIRMFPVVERNQFCLELYMDSGTRLETTNEAVKKLEALLFKDKRVMDVASFVGTSSPRFYLTYAPQSPAPNYAQILINTTSARATQEMIDELLLSLPGSIPNGQIKVKQLQQGPPVEAPIEIRVTGTNLPDIKRVGEKIKKMMFTTSGTNFVRSTFREECFDVGIEVDDEVANRLGLSSQDIARALAINFKGASVSTLWEGDNPIDILLRLEKERRDDFTDLEGAYITSPITGASIALRQVARLVPTWQTGQIMRRNGLRCLTIRSEAQMGRLPNDILQEVMPKIAAMKLPPGIQVSYGGELEDQKTTMGEFSAALATSLVLIFMVLLFQFKQLQKALIIMVTIPLSWFGAILGLTLTGNPFCFTGFLGVISLSGLVVRNGIILIQYADEIFEKGDRRSALKAALHAGQRRMRPVFLTSVAAAAGVVPMIIGRSPLWAPLGAVLSVGLICGMILTLFMVPVLYALIMKKSEVPCEKGVKHWAQAQAN